ncbi:hypothetical protein QS306_03985 [Paraburkholderia bonniea]|nr:hypothetical protein [Paraburkholderia bonniea]WJF90833.1 hypothetical protein QS306_03985 [Paraburkholderia bonniea]WJF94147.1 hypothetical protein QS308_03985 [Paraburkholderia bonniea]
MPTHALSNLAHKRDTKHDETPFPHIGYPVLTRPKFACRESKRH